MTTRKHIAICAALLALALPGGAGAAARAQTSAAAATADNEGSHAGGSFGVSHVYRVVPGQTFVAIPHFLLKFSGTGGSGQNMFAIQHSGSTWATLPGYPYLLGVQHFSGNVTDVDYIGGDTVVSLDDGRILKVTGTGGTGENMFAVNETSSGFAGIAPYPYFVGAHRFQSGIVSVTPVGGVTFVAFQNHKLLKVLGAGGGGANMFAITETAGGFSGLAGYPYYQGDQLFDAPVTAITPVGGITFIGLADGKLLKVNGTGGTGHNMFAVSETGTSFSGLAGYPYYAGDETFAGAVGSVTELDGFTLVATRENDGLSPAIAPKLLEVVGTGGAGHNMFAVNESATAFSGLSGYHYYVGDQSLPADATGIFEVGGVTFISFDDGEQLEIAGTGGAGHDMLGLTSLLHSQYLLGSSSFNSPVTDAVYLDGDMIVALANGKFLKASLAGSGLGPNMFDVIQTASGFVAASNTSPLIGSFLAY